MTMTVTPLNYMIGKGIVSVFTGASSVTRWAASTAYTTDAYVVLSTGTVYKATAAGTSGASEPTTVGTDSGVVWAAITLSDVGNVGKFEFQPEVQTIDHYSSRAGTAILDLRADVRRLAKFSMEMDEIAIENLSFALLSSGLTGSTGSRTMKIFDAARSNVIFDLRMTNDIGKHFHVVFPSCRIYPPKNIGFIDQEFVKLAVDADVFALNDNSFGTIQEIA